MSKIGYYLRTSHYLMNIGTQRDIIEPDWVVYEDKGISGTIPFSERPSGKRLLRDIEKGKIKEVKVLRIDRLGRCVEDLICTLNTIHSYKVPITSKNEGITTLDENGKQTPMTGLMINLLVSISEFQYHQLREKILTGIERSKLIPGKYPGRRPGSVESLEKFMSKPRVRKVLELLEEGVGIRKIGRIMDVSPNFVLKVKKRCLETT